ncbi:MAG TPA: MFS transporter [Chloroflexota bacterium]|nr:MFS transporter [Chloroflexota bacterium]
MTAEQAEPRSTGLAAFHYPNYTWYWISQVTTNIGTWMMQVATGWLVLQITNSPASLGFNAAFQAGPILLFALVGGAIADRIDRYRLMVASYIVQVVPDALLAWLVVSGNIRVEHVYIYSVVTATINGLSTPARQAFVPRLVPKEVLLSAMALNSIVWQGAAVVGPALAGMILAFWGVPGSFNINVASDLVSIVAILLVRVAPLEIERSGRSGLGDMREGLAYAWRRPSVRMLLVSIAVVTFLSRPYSQLMPAFARDVFAVGPQGLGWMLTVPAMGSVAVGLTLAALRRLSMVRAFLLLALTMAAALIGFCITRSFPVALCLLFVVGGCSTGSNTLANTMIQETADEHVRGRVMALFMACTWGMWRLGSLPVGLAAQAWGPPLAVGMAAALLAAMVLPLSRSRGLHAAEPSRSLVQPPQAPAEPAMAGRAS